MSAQVEGYAQREGSAFPWWRPDGQGINLITPDMLPLLTDSKEVRKEKVDKLATVCGMNWQAEKVPLFQQVGTDKLGEPIFAELSNDYLVRRNTDFQPLGLFRRSGADSDGYYEPNDPPAILETILEFCEVAANEVGMEFETAGSLKQGKQIWAQAKIPSEYLVNGEAHERYVSFLDSFDGSTSLTGQAGLTRIVCANTFAISLSEKGNPRIKLNHSRKFEGARKDEFITGLKLIMEQHNQYKIAAELLAKKKQPTAEAEKFLSRLLFTPELVKQKAANGDMFEVLTEASTKTQNNIERLIQSYKDTVEEGTDKNTLWTTWNAVTRYADHSMGVKKRGGKDEVQAKIESAGFGSGQKLKEEAFSQLLKLAA